MNFSDTDKLPAFDNHKLVTFINNKNTGLKGFIAIHRINSKYPAFGATRIWDYKNSEEALTDALRLSRTMSHKAALAGLHCGGAKAVIISDGVQNRSAFLRSYAEEVNHLGGSFITGADVGVDRADVIKMRRLSKFFVGTKVDPVRFTGLGLLYSLQACVKSVYGRENLEERTLAIQGVGKIGSELLKLVYPLAKKIYIADIDKKTLEVVKKRFPKVRVVSPSEIYKAEVDIFSPCALGNSLTQDKIKQLKCAMIVGGANCQLESEGVGLKLHEKGILYAPDYLVNAGGLISVYYEYEDSKAHIRKIIKRVKKIKNTMRNIIILSKEKNKPTFLIANQISEKIIRRLD
jgi:leucine dehydrogenase